MTAEKLKGLGVQTLAVIATKAERARLYYRFRPPRCAVGADPDLITHRAYGVPQAALTPEILQAAGSQAAHLAAELQLKVPETEAWGALDRLDGFTRTEGDNAEFQRHQAQFVGTFLMDREGIIRWANIESAQEDLAGLDKFPTDDELLAAARAL